MVLAGAECRSRGLALDQFMMSSTRYQDCRRPDSVYSPVRTV